MSIKGAGGSPGGSIKFIGGACLMVIGLYLILKNINVYSGFAFNRTLQFGNTSFTSGLLLFPFVIGIVMLFYNSKNIIGWLLSLGSVALLIVGVIASIQFTFAGSNAFDILLILLIFGAGVGLLLSSFKSQ
jgi:hypothetical protein